MRSLVAVFALVLVLAGRADAVPVPGDVVTYTNPNVINFYAKDNATFLQQQSGLPGGWSLYVNGSFAQLSLINSPQFTGTPRNLSYTQFFDNFLPTAISVQELAWNFTNNTFFVSSQYDATQSSPGVYGGIAGYSGPPGVTPFVGPEPSTMVGMAAVVVLGVVTGRRRRVAVTS